MANDPTGMALSVLTRLSGSPLVDKFKLRKPLDALVYRGSRAGFATIKQANQTFKPIKKLSKAIRSPKPGSDLPDQFDLSLTDEQTMIVDAVRRLASQVIAPAAEAADDACSTPAEVLQQIHELGIGLLAIPEALGGMGGQYAPTTHAIVAEELARGDQGIALAALAPLGIVNALSSWGTASQQAKYLSAFAGDNFIPAALAVNGFYPIKTDG